MRKSLVLFAVVASLCAFACAQTMSDGSSANAQQADATPSDTQPASAPAPPVSLGDYARQLRLKRQQREAQLQQAKENQSNQNQVKETLPKDNQAKDNQAQNSPEKQSSSPAVEAVDVKPTPQTSQPSPKLQTAAAPHVEQAPVVISQPQPKPQIVTTAAIPTRPTVTNASARQTVSPVAQSSPVPTEAQIRGWKAEIQQQKGLVASLQQDVTDLNNSIHLAGGDCIANCDQWNDRQKQKKQDLDTLKAQLQEQQDILAEMLEAERVLIPTSAQNLR